MDSRQCHDNINGKLLYVAVVAQDSVCAYSCMRFAIRIVMETTILSSGDHGWDEKDL